MLAQASQSRMFLEHDGREALLEDALEARAQLGSPEGSQAQVAEQRIGVRRFLERQHGDQSALDHARDPLGVAILGNDSLAELEIPRRAPVSGRRVVRLLRWKPVAPRLPGVGRQRAAGQATARVHGGPVHGAAVDVQGTE